MKKILITGAGGFIGGRLVEVLKETLNPEINILLRRIEKAARISSYPLHYFRGDIQDKRSIETAMIGCDAVVHCAHDFMDPDANLKAAELISKNCIQNGIKRLVYISSFAIHKGDNAETINEATELNDQWDYAINKTAIEEKLIGFYRDKGLPVIILRPTIVYGPFASAWTTNTINQMIAGRLAIPYEGDRKCNAVYIDDVIQAIIKALHAPDICNGRSYIVSGDDIVSWNEFYNSHLACKGTNTPVFMTRKESDEWQDKLQAGNKIVKRNSVVKDPITFFKQTPVYTFYQKLLKNPLLKKKLLSAKANIPRPIIYFDRDAFETHSCKGKADISRIKDELGFGPVFSFQEGMKNTLAWVEWANLNLET